MDIDTVDIGTVYITDISPMFLVSEVNSRHLTVSGWFVKTAPNRKNDLFPVSLDAPVDVRQCFINLDEKETIGAQCLMGVRYDLPDSVWEDILRTCYLREEIAKDMEKLPHEREWVSVFLQAVWSWEDLETFSGDVLRTLSGVELARMYRDSDGQFCAKVGSRKIYGGNSLKEVIETVLCTCVD